MKEIEGWRLEQDTLNGKKLMLTLYIDKRTAELAATEKTEEWFGYKAVPAKARILSKTEAAIGSELLTIDRTASKDALKHAALKKLTAEERKALGL